VAHAAADEVVEIIEFGECAAHVVDGRRWWRRQLGIALVDGIAEQAGRADAVGRVRSVAGCVECSCSGMGRTLRKARLARKESRSAAL